MRTPEEVCGWQMDLMDKIQKHLTSRNISLDAVNLITITKEPQREDGHDFYKATIIFK